MKSQRQILKIVKKLGAFCLGIVLFLGLSGLPTFAADPFKLELPQVPILDRHPPQDVTPIAPPEPAPNAPGLGDRAEFMAFADDFFEEEMPKSHVPGAAIAIVKDGEVFYTQGYGYADLAQNIPVEADKTLFRVASLSKTVTATATMQLHERGVIDVNEDVTPYLGEQVNLNNPFSEPVTFARMMMHNDGTTRRMIGLAASTPEKMQPLGEYLGENMPAIARPPGTFYSYSNHSIALLGYLVQEISDTPFVEYIEKNIFDPLEMSRSSFRQPLPPSLADDLATGYQWNKSQNEFKPVPFLYLNIAPAAALGTTATDMARYMQAHLRDDSAILQPQTLELMHETHFRQHPRLPGTAYGFRENTINDIRVIGHFGSLRGYSSSLTLVPDRGLGIFIVSNSFSGIHTKFTKQLFDRYFPATDSPTPPENTATVDLEPYTGIYRDLEYPRNTIAKLTAVFQETWITKGENKTLLVKRPNLLFPQSVQPLVLNPVDPPLFQHADRSDLTAFEPSDSNKMAYAYNLIPSRIGTYERVAWYNTIWTHLILLLLCIGVFLSAAYVYPLKPLWRRLRGKSFQMTRSHPWPWQLAGITSLLNLIFLIGFPLSIWLYTPWKLAYGFPTIAIAFLTLPLITLAFSLGILLYGVLAWMSPQWSWGDRIHYSSVGVAAIVFIAIASYWNLLGFKF
ncbi:MAG: serine hydrolase domain-containing protein [Spirulinaceae cyanobacterium]